MLLFLSCSSDIWEYVPEVIELDGVKAYIAHYYDNKTSCITLTFDDGTYDQYENAVPQLERRNLPATFFINGRKIRSYDQSKYNLLSESDVYDLFQRGFEVSNHTWGHTKLTTISLDSVRKEIAMNDSAIEKWTGKRPLTLSFPHNARTDELIAIAMEGRVGVRTFETGFGQTERKDTYTNLKKWVDKCIENRSWSVAMLHGINKDYDYWRNPDILWNFFDYISSKTGTVWIANFHDAVSYVTERDKSKLQLYKNDNGDVVAIVATTLDTNLYKQPLTLVVQHDDVTELVDAIPNQPVVLVKH